MSSRSLVSKSRKDTEQIAKNFLGRILNNKKAKHSTIVALSGELGAGKTTFVQAVGKELGIKGKMRSPTFLIIKKYTLKNIPKFNFLFHLDAYRLKSEKELLYLGWEEIINNAGHLVFVEWPENVAKVIPKHAKLVEIAHAGGKERHFKLK